MPDEACRLAKVEEHLQNLDVVHHFHIARTEEKLSEVFDLLHEIKNTQSNQKGFIAGITFTITSVFAVAVYFLGKQN